MGIDKTHGRNYDLSRLLSAIDEGNVVLPEFQRSFKWDTTAVRQLIATCLSGWPVGSLLLLPGTSDVFFKVREIESAPPARSDFQTVVLDGQQRLTSLYQALFGRGEFKYAVEYRNLRPGQTIEELEDALVSFPIARWGRIHPDAKSEYAAGRIPVTALRSAADFFTWRDEALAGAPSAERDQITKIYIDRLSGLDRYEIPAVVIDDTVHPEAIARIFERVNRLGQPLGTFDLMVAKSYKEGFNLRDEWDTAHAEMPRIREFLKSDGLPILSVIALQVRNSLRQQDVLALTGAAVRDYWRRAVGALDTAIAFLQDELHVFGPDWLPYRTQLTLIGCLALNGALSDRRDVITRWFWTSTFRARYDVASNTRAVDDYSKLRNNEEVFSGETSLDPDVMLTVNRRQYGALHRGLICLYASDRPKGIIGGEDLLSEAAAGETITTASVLPRSESIQGRAANTLSLGLLLGTQSSLRGIESIALPEVAVESLHSQFMPSHASVADVALLLARLDEVALRLTTLTGLPARVVPSE